VNRSGGPQYHAARISRGTNITRHRYHAVTRSGFNLRLFFRKMKKSEIFRKLLKTNPEKFRKDFGDDPENSGHFEGSVPELPRRILGPFR
jgi:hypothetical protein